MVEQIKTLLTPPVYPEDEDKTRIARLLQIVLLTLIALLSFNTAVAILLLQDLVSVFLNAGTVLVTVALFILLRRGHVRLAGILTVTIFWITVAATSFFVSGFTIIIVSSYFVLVFLAGVVVNKRAGILFALLSIGAGIIATILESRGQFLSSTPANPIVNLSATAVNLLALAIILYLNLQNLEEALARSWQSKRELEASQVLLEARVAERTRDLALAAEIGRSIASFRNVNTLLSGAVNIIQSYFDLYYTQIYLVDEARGTLELKAAHGQAAEQLLRQAHFLTITADSINGTAALEKRPVLVANTAEDPMFRPNPLLPLTRSEMAIPLISAHKVLGVLDLQSASFHSFSADNLPAFEALAGQLAVALENASLFSELEETSRTLQTLLDDTERKATQESSLNVLSAAFATASSVNELVQTASQEITDLRAADQVFIALTAQDGKTVEVLSLPGEDGAIQVEGRFALAETAVNLAIQESRTLSFPHDLPFTAYADSDSFAQQGCQSLLVLPLTITGQVLGALNIGRQEPHLYSDTEKQFDQQIATLLAQNLERVRLTEQIRGLADIVENHPDFMGVTALDGRVLYANPTGLTMLGLPADHAITGMTAAEFYVPEDAHIIQQTGFPTAVKTGSWTGELRLRTSDDVIIPVETTLSAHADANNAPRNVSITMRNISERQQAAAAQRQLTAQLEERLHQVNALQRTMTREGWSEFLSSPNRLVQGYTFDNGEIHLLSRQDVSKPEIPKLSSLENAPDADSIARPMLVRGETIGVLGARNPSGEPLTEEQEEILTALSAEVAEALDRARLFEEMELTQTEMEKLYAGSERVVQANSIQDVLKALVDSTALKNMDRVSFLFFDQPWDTQTPEFLTIAALWYKNGRPTQSAIGLSYKLATLPSFKHINRHEPTIFRALGEKDERVGADAQKLADELGAKSVVYFPLTAGEQWFGLLSAQSAEDLTLTEAEIRQINSLAGQAASVSQTQRLFEQTQARARRERALREVTARVFAAADADTILQTAVREVNRTLGLETFIYLQQVDEAPGHSTNGRDPLEN